MKSPASKNNNFLYNKNLKEKAIHLRNNATKAEACMWKYVLKASLLGYPFKRQRPILSFIADFMSSDLMLIIEVDGITHSYEEVATKDERRQRKMEEVGFTVIRFTDEEVLTSTHRVREKMCGLIIN